MKTPLKIAFTVAIVDYHPYCREYIVLLFSVYQVLNKQLNFLMVEKTDYFNNQDQHKLTPIVTGIFQQLISCVFFK
jgi:hypothetical protein